MASFNMQMDSRIDGFDCPFFITKGRMGGGLFFGHGNFLT